MVRSRNECACTFHHLSLRASISRSFTSIGQAVDEVLLHQHVELSRVMHSHSAGMAWQDWHSAGTMHCCSQPAIRTSWLETPTQILASFHARYKKDAAVGCAGGALTRQVQQHDAHASQGVHESAALQGGSKVEQTAGEL